MMSQLRIEPNAIIVHSAASGRIARTLSVLTTILNPRTKR